MPRVRYLPAFAAALALAGPVSAQQTRAQIADPDAAPAPLATRTRPLFAGTIRTLPPLELATPSLPGVVPADQQRQAIEYSDAYYTRLTIHRIGSYAMLPLFATEYLLGKRLMDGGDVPGWVRSAHGTVAGGIGVLFGVNTLTGVWNLWEGRKEPEGRARRFLHSALMIAADAGFLYTASLAEDDDEFEFGEDGGGSFRSGNRSTRHRDAALVSIGMSTAGTLLMWLWKD